MDETWIVNASPLITLAKAGCLDALLAPHRTVLITDTVAAEVLAGEPSDPARQALEAGWGERVDAGPVPDAVAAFGLDPGEASVLTAALGRERCVVVLDDARARRSAEALRIRLRGAVGVVVAARQAGRIESAAAAIERLRAAGLYVDDALVDRALALAGEPRIAE